MDKQHSKNLLAICVLTCVTLCAMAALLIGAKLYPPAAYAAGNGDYFGATRKVTVKVKVR